MSSDLSLLDTFKASLAGRAPKTIQSYMSIVERFMVWVMTKPGGTPFRLALLTETALQEYMDMLAQSDYAPRTAVFLFNQGEYLGQGQYFDVVRNLLTPEELRAYFP